MGFLHQMRTLHSQIPVIVASAAVEASERSVSMGAFAFIPHPINLDELGRLVARVFAANRQGRALADDSAVG